MPFELGRPVGAPGDSEFQHRVIAAALDLFARPSGPVLEAFPEDAPGRGPDTGDKSAWVCPVNFAPPRDAIAAGSPLAAVLAEVDQLRPWHQLALEQRGDTTAALSGLDIEAAARLLAGFLDDRSIESPRPGLKLPQALKFAADDLKAYYFEAATARPGPNSSAELNAWFWSETAGGALLLELSAACRGIDTPAMQLLGHKGLVPRIYEHLVP